MPNAFRKNMRDVAGSFLKYEGIGTFRKNLSLFAWDFERNLKVIA
jgi:hypothetical protein